MSSASIPLISALPQFGFGGGTDMLASASPDVNSLLSSTGNNLTNMNSLGAGNQNLGSLFSLLSPGGGISPEQGAQFGPLFSVLMALQGNLGGAPQPGLVKGM